MSAHSEPKTESFGKQRTRWVKRPDLSRSTDADLAAAAADAIEVLTTVPPESIKVTARNGWLYLEGEVDWRHQRIIVEDVTRHLPGVRGVIDSITINAGLQ
jgi:osmotically-inducible protein OsmY